MAPAVDREISIEYGDPATTGVRLGGDTDRLILAWSVRVAYDRATVEVTFLVTAADAAAMATESALLDARLSTPRQRVRVLADGSTWHDWDPSANTGFDAESEISFPPDRKSTLISRVGVWSCSIALPADLTGQEGRFESRVAVAYSPSRKRTITITGTYTALSGNEARDQYEAEIDDFAASAITGLGLTIGTDCELVEEPEAATNDSGKVLTFTRVYREIIAGQATGAFDDAELVDPSVTMRRRQTSTPSSVIDGREVTEPVEIAVRYDAGVRFDLETDLYAKFRDDVLPRLTEHVRTAFDASDLALIDIAPDLDVHQNRIAADLVYLVFDAGGLLSATQTTTEETPTGAALVPANSDDPLAHFEFRGPVRKLRTITTTTTERTGGGGSVSAGAGGAIGVFGFGKAGQIGGFNGNLGAIAGVGSGDVGAGVFGFGSRGFQINFPGGGGGQEAGAAAGGGAGGGNGRWVDLGTRETKTPRRRGLEGLAVDELERTFETQMQFVTDPPAKPGNAPPPGTTSIARESGL